jgi:hypothetical protein
MTDPLELLSRMSLRKPSRLANYILGPAKIVPSSSFLESLGAELGLELKAPDFFGLAIELDTLYAAFMAAATPSKELFEDRRGYIEMDRFKIDAVLAYRSPIGENDAPAGSGEAPAIDLILIQGRNSGKWTGRRSKRIAERMRRVFGDDGRALPHARVRFVALGIERPNNAATAAWPAWMLHAGGTSTWLPFGRAEGELRVIRCDRHGRPRASGDFWKLG